MEMWLNGGGLAQTYNPLPRNLKDFSFNEAGRPNQTIQSIPFRKKKSKLSFFFMKSNWIYLIWLSEDKRYYNSKLVREDL